MEKRLENLSNKEKRVAKKIKKLQHEQKKIEIEFEIVEVSIKAISNKEVNDRLWDLHKIFQRYVKNSELQSAAFEVLSDLQGESVKEVHNFVRTGLCGLEALTLYRSFDEFAMRAIADEADDETDDEMPELEKPTKEAEDPSKLEKVELPREGEMPELEKPTKEAEDLSELEKVESPTKEAADPPDTPKLVSVFKISAVPYDDVYKITTSIILTSDRQVQPRLLTG